MARAFCSRGVIRSAGWVGSGCGAVLVDESGAGGATLDRVAWADRDNVGGVVGCTLVDSAVGAVAVVVVDVVDEQRTQLFLVPDNRAVEQSSWRSVRTHRSAYALAWGDRGGVRRAVICEPARTSSKERVNCPAPSLMRNRNP